TLVQRWRKWLRRHQAVVWSAAIGLLVALAVLAGSVGWVLRDRAAQHAKIANDLRAAWEEAQQAHSESKWPRAQAAAKRAEGLLQDAPAAPELAQLVRDLLRQLAEEEADRLLVARLEKLRLLQAEVNGQGRFVLERALPDYREAFRGYGLQVDTI